MDKNNFVMEKNTVWSFPKRGSWKSHNSNYRGNFAPQIPRNIILKYSEEGDVILDPMMGGGTTLIEAKILNRRSIGLDINKNAVKITEKNLDFKGNYRYQPDFYLGDARDLSYLDDKSIDLIVFHPPYWNIINYSKGSNKNDISNINDLEIFFDELNIIIKELYRVLKNECYCGVLIGDTRKHQHYIPLSYKLMTLFLENNFLLKEEIIKIQHNCSRDKYWYNKIDDYNFYLIKHEHLFIFKKINRNNISNKYKYSSKKFI